MSRDFKRDSERKKKKFNPINETKLSNPEKTFNLDSFSEEKKEKTDVKAGRPKKNKVYGTVRLQKKNVNRVNALQNTLDLETQDDLISSLLDRIENSLESEQRIMFDMYMRTYTNRDNKKHNAF